MKNIQATLEGITVESGYANTLRSVQRFRQDGQDLANVPMVVLIDNGDNVESKRAIELTERALTISVVLIHRQESDVDSRSSSEIMNSLIADVQKVMQVDQARGGVAVNTFEDGIGEIDVQDGQPELMQSIGYRITYRHERNDPTAAA